jgi:hypothetical protein
MHDFFQSVPNPWSWLSQSIQLNDTGAQPFIAILTLRPRTSVAYTMMYSESFEQITYLQDTWNSLTFLYEFDERFG